MTLCGVHDNMHVHTTVAHTCDYPLYFYRHTSTRGREGGNGYILVQISNNYRIDLSKIHMYYLLIQQDNQRWQIPRPATCQCLAMFTPLKSKIYFFVTSFLCSLELYFFNRKGYPRGSHEKYLKEIVGPVFEK